MAQYDPQYVEHLADEIMAAASRFVTIRTIVWGFIGLLIGFAAGASAGFFSSGTSLIGALIGGILGAALGYWTAQTVVLRMRAEAQLMLTQLEIEKNTRGKNIHKPFNDTQGHGRSLPPVSPNPMNSPTPEVKNYQTPIATPAPPPPSVASRPAVSNTQQSPANPPSRNPPSRGNRR
ncbi:MAG: hypothetical protein WBC71_09490 [Salaquimonas sp.]